MRQVLLLLLSIITFTASAQTIEYHPKSSTRTRGLAYYRNSNFAPGQRLVVVVHGIDERGLEDLAGLRKVATWPGWGNIKVLAEKYKFNLVFTQSNQDNTTDEIDYAISQGAIDLQADTSKIHGFGYSWGGRRWKIWVNRNLEGAKKLKSLMRVSSGGVDIDDATNTIAANLPTWLLHAVDDGRTSYKNSWVTFDNAKRLNPSAPVYYTQYKAKLDTVYNGHNTLKNIGDWTIASVANTNPTPVGYPYPYTTSPKVTLNQWWEMNEWKRPSAPEVLYVARPAPQPIPVPVRSLLKADTIRQRIIYDTTLTKIIYFYSDNTYEVR